MKNTIVVPVGRDFGLAGEQNGVKYYAVGSVLNKVMLTHLEYFSWKMLRKYKSLEEWKENLQAKISQKFKNVAINDILAKLVANSLITTWDFTDPTDATFRNTYIIRNGNPLETKESKYFIKGPFVNDELTLTHSQYVLWNAAAGFSPLIDVLAQAMEDLNIEDDEQIIDLLKTDGLNLVRVGLWDIELLALDGAEQNDE